MKTKHLTMRIQCRKFLMNYMSEATQIMLSCKFTLSKTSWALLIMS